MIGMQQYGRQGVVEMLDRLGYRDRTDEASRDLPDPVDIDQLEEWADHHGVLLDQMSSQMGSSP